jgi:type II secretory ATPase GspE/PulE/Tfp pilus assembly ATPase PilB-like protein/FixJ family two-component response regulator/RNA polymerase subunit RPABC4/transcription elongation factor Spt4
MSKYSELFRSPEKGEPREPSADETRSGEEAGKSDVFTLLFVDDEIGVLNALRRIFLEENYTIFTASSADEALDVMRREKVHLVVSDHRMPGATGAQLLREIKEKWPDTIRIMLTGYADVQSIMGAVNEGAVYKFITKPWNDEDLRLTVSLALQQYVLIQENRQLKSLTKKQQLKIRNYSALFDENRGVMGNILIKAGVVSKDDCERAAGEKQNDEFLSDTLVRLGITTESKIVRALQSHLKLEYIDLREMNLNHTVVRFLPRELCERNRLIPIRLDARQVTIAMADPSDIFKCDNISLLTGLKVIPVISTSSDILGQLRRVYGDGGAEDLADLDELQEIEPMDEIDIVIDEEEKDVSVQELIGSSEVPPIIRIVNAVISEAVRLKASDIHIEPKTKYTVIRYRIDGMLHSKIRVPADLHAAVVSRIKILGKLDISERRRPQDGRITVKAGTRLVDIRVSTMPTINGEKIVMRILDKNAAIKKLDELGVEPDELKNIFSLIKKPQGIIISTGPTGSGKTTMLYSILNAMLEGTKNFETIEDPVEYFLEDASQVYIREKVGLSFASVLRATMRQDPDVILVGEIRDFETADVAFKAALTGHMVLTTLHTNNSIASITRMLDMGVKPYLIASALEGILAQRLVRKICKYCKIREKPDGELMELLKIPAGAFDGEVFKGKGCERCNHTGYLGRTGIFELFVMNDDFRYFIGSNYKEAELMNMARAAGMKTLVEAGIEKVKRGETTIEELIRVIGPQTKHERRCENCQKMIDAKFLFCPLCGSFKQNVCIHCRKPLERGWSVCPFCGGARTAGDKITSEGGYGRGGFDTLGG